MKTLPWQQPPLDEWDIVTINHYQCCGEKHIFIAMKKGHSMVTEKGEDDEYIWNRLWHKANETGDNHD